MVRLALVLGALALCSPLAARAACPKNPAKPATIDGVKVKKGSCGPFMMKASDISDGYYDCEDAKGKSLKAHYKDCAQLNAKGSGKADKDDALKGKKKSGGKKSRD